MWTVPLECGPISRSASVHSDSRWTTGRCQFRFDFIFCGPCQGSTYGLWGVKGPAVDFWGPGSVMCSCIRWNASLGKLDLKFYWGCPFNADSMLITHRDARESHVIQKNRQRHGTPKAMFFCRARQQKWFCYLFGVASSSFFALFLQALYLRFYRSRRVRFL